MEFVISKMLNIYCFSCTGKVKSAAIWFNESAEKHNLLATTVEIAPMKSGQAQKPGHGVVFGFISPTRRASFPPIILNFLMKFKIFDRFSILAALTYLKYWRRYGIRYHKNEPYEK